MVIICKESKLDKIELLNMFQVIGVSNEEIDGAEQLTILLPPDYADLMKDDVKKKKAAKHYFKYLSSADSYQEWMLYSIAVSIHNGNSVVFVCSDEEWECGYLEMLADYLTETFGIEVTGIKDSKDTIEAVYDALEKKDRKLLNADKEDLDEKKEKKLRKLVKGIKEELSSDVDENEYLEVLENKYGTEACYFSLVNAGIILLNKEGKFKSVIDGEIDVKKKDLVEAIMAPKDVSKKDSDMPKIVKRILEGHDIKYKDKALGEESKTSLVSIIAEIHTALEAVRAGTEA